ncbi:MAG: hypothetical protein M0D57_17500 [Sphingobacteriales bacterium JAD_PAG50586_3]|nr:MAG: hypothetical protein M0D57_17500 [Sphingobacteriales bacterium JAD_PAG50586_3]
MADKLMSVFYCLLYNVFNVSPSAIIKYQLNGPRPSNAKEWFGFLLNFNVVIAFWVIFLLTLIMFKALYTGQFLFIITVATVINLFLLLGWVL